MAVDEVTLDDKASAKEAKKKAKEEAKAAKKAAKAAKAENPDIDDEEEKLGIGGRLIMLLAGLIIILVWLAIFALLIKMDVGGFGSTVLFPLLKDVPYVNQILPGIEEYELTEEDMKYRYASVDDAVFRIKELEAEIEKLKGEGDTKADYIAELEAAKAELEVYKADEARFEEVKEKFYEEVVFSDNAPDIEEYKKYYESISPENAEIIYKQVVNQLQTEKEVQEYADTYSSMKPKEAAAIFDTMEKDLRLVGRILWTMDVGPRSDILAAMDEELAAKITKMMEP